MPYCNDQRRAGWWSTRRCGPVAPLYRWARWPLSTGAKPGLERVVPLDWSLIESRLAELEAPYLIFQWMRRTGHPAPKLFRIDIISRELSNVC